MTSKDGTLGKYVRRLRIQHGFQQKQLAKIAGVDAGWLSKLEHDLYGSPDPRSLYRVARALDVETADLYFAAGYGNGSRLPAFAGYLRAKYQLPEDAVEQLQNHFDLINEHYQGLKGGHYGTDHDRPARSSSDPTAEPD